jgi:hypothetical protein
MILVATCSGNLVDTLPKCKVSDKECLIRHVELLFRAHDPVFVEKMVMNQNGEGAIGISLEYTNATIYGLKNARVYSVKGIEADPEGNKIEMRFRIPTVTTLATYAADGKVLFLNIHAKGNVNLTFGNNYYYINLNFRIIMKISVDEDAKLLLLTKKVEINNEIHMQVVKAKLDFDIKK